MHVLYDLESLSLTSGQAEFYDYSVLLRDWKEIENRLSTLVGGAIGILGRHLRKVDLQGRVLTFRTRHVIGQEHLNELTDLCETEKAIPQNF